MASSSASHSAAAGSSTAAGSSAYEVVPHNRKAPMWAYFDMVRLIEDGEFKAKCKRCGKLLAAKGNSSLLRHANHCNAQSAPEEGQAQISQSGYSWNYDQQLQRELQMKCVISRGLPFNTFDNDTMTNYIHQGLQPKYQKVSRFTIRRDAYKAYLKAKKELIIYFQNFDARFSLTCDVWTSGLNLGLSYICTTSHWIDENWTMHKRIISFETFEHPHTGTAIYQMLLNVTTEFKIKDKLISISFDNASNNTSATILLQRSINPPLNGAFLHTRCFCHILNLIVQVALENPFVKCFVTKIKTLLVFVYSSSKRRQAFKKFVHSKGEKFLKPEFDMPIRWNSTYKMLKRALRQKDLLMEFYAFTNMDFDTMESDILESDWEFTENLIIILQVFYDATITLSGIYYPTSPLVLGEILVISIMFQNYREHEFWGEIILEMQEKLVKYLQCINPAFLCAAALNPMIGVQGVENILEDIIENLHLDMTNDDNLALSVNVYNKYLTLFYSHYDTFYGIRTRDCSSSSSSSSRFDSGSTKDAIMQSAARKKSKSVGGLDELAIYTQTDFSLILSQENVSTFDILKWWKNNSRQFPVLSAMARDVLTIQASTVASESAFSSSGRILNERRSRLSPQSMEVCICFKDYLDAAERKQNVNAIEDSSEEVEDEMLELEEDEE